MITKTVRNIWTLATLAMVFFILKGMLTVGATFQSLAEAISYNFLLVGVYLYGKESIQNAMPVMKLWIDRKRPLTKPLQEE